jgi:hypothetical protein
MALISAGMISLAAQHPKGAAKSYLLDGTPADSPLAGTLPRIEISFDSHEPCHRRFPLVPHKIDVDMQCPQRPTLALCVHP